MPSASSNSSREPRAVLHRLLKLHQLFHEQWRDSNPERRFKTADELAKYIGRARSGFFRILQIMQDDHDMPVDFIPERGGYGYTREVTNFPAIQFTQPELIAIFASLNSLKSIRGNPFNDAAQSAFDKLALALEGQLTVDLDALTSVICFRSGGFPAPVDPAYIETATRAAVDCQELTLHYTKIPKPGDRPSSKVHHVQPLLLLCAGEAWYLYAHDLAAEEIRRFALTRIDQMLPNGRQFKVPRGFRRASVIGNGFGTGLFGDDNPQKIRLKASRDIAQIIRERVWHDTQKIRHLGPGAEADSELELTLKVPLSPELENWILSWGNRMTVLGPATLRKTIEFRRTAVGEAKDRETGGAESA